MNPLPPQPGSLPIPRGHLRLYHQTDTASLESIRGEGLGSSHSRSQDYGEPEGIWLSTHAPFYGGDSGWATGPVIEVDLPADDPRIMRGAGSWPHPESQEAIDGWNEQLCTVLVSGTIKVHELRVHEPWHRAYRMLEGREDRGQYDSMLDDPDQGPAVQRWKADQAAERALDAGSIDL